MGVTVGCITSIDRTCPLTLQQSQPSPHLKWISDFSERKIKVGVALALKGGPTRTFKIDSYTKTLFAVFTIVSLISM